LLILLCLTACVGALYLLFDPIIQHVILGRLVLRNDTEFAEIWAEPPITPHLKLYYFNLTNAERFFAGEEGPKVEEVGPYVYLQRWIKEDVEWHGNGTMSYRTRKNYTFMPDLSVNPETGRRNHHSKDTITTVNVPLISAVKKFQDNPFWLKVALFGLGSEMKTLERSSWLLPSSQRTLLEKLTRNYTRGKLLDQCNPTWFPPKPNCDFWVKKTPEELTWGYNDALLEIGQLTDEKLTDKFGFFLQNNKTDDLPKYTMYTGEGNPYNLSKISLFDGSDSLKVWGKNPETDQNKCNLVQGSDGATFNPYIEQTDTLWFFNDQLCQSMPLVFQKEVQASRLPGYRFVPRHDVFKHPRSEPSNACFCEDEPLCDVIGDGMFSISKCPKIMGAPIVLSWPHFLHANSSFIDAVQGMNPDKEKHQFFFDVQPTTGSTLSARARAQINIVVLQNSDFSGLDKVKNTTVPLLWFDEGLDELGDELRSEIAKAVEDPPVYKGYILIGLGCLVGVVVAVGTISAVMTCRSRGKRRSLTHYSLDEGDIGGQEPKDSIIKNSSGVGVGLMRARSATGNSQESANIRAVRSIINEHLPQGTRSLISSEEVCMRLLESGSSTEASSAENSRLSSASHSRNSSTGSNAMGGSCSQPSGPAAAPPPAAASSQQQQLSRGVSALPAVHTIPEVSSSAALLDPDEAAFKYC